MCDAQIFIHPSLREGQAASDVGYRIIWHIRPWFFVSHKTMFFWGPLRLPTTFDAEDHRFGEREGGDKSTCIYKHVWFNQLVFMAFILFLVTITNWDCCRYACLFLLHLSLLYRLLLLRRILFRKGEKRHSALPPIFFIRDLYNISIICGLLFIWTARCI